MKSRFICLMLLLALLLSGCQGGVENVQSAIEPKVVSVLYGQSTSDPGLEDVFTQCLSQRFPDVTLDWESVDWGEQFSSMLSMKIAAGEVPDLIIGKAQDVHAFYPTGILTPLDSALTSHIQPMALGRVSFDGQAYGLPYNMLYQGVLYNKNIFYRYGLSVPNTLAELQSVVSRLESMGVTPIGTHFQEVWYTGNILMQFAANDVFRASSDWGERFRRGETSYADDALWRHCYEQARYVLEHSWPDALTIAQSEADRRFSDEGCAMYLTGSWSIQTLLTIAPQRKLGIFPYPNRTGDAKLLYEPNITFMMGATSQNRELVARMLESILEDPELAENVFQFTQTDSTLGDITSGTLGILRESIDAYKSQGRMLDVSLGNNQLVWQFQYACAQAALDWLKGLETLDGALAVADEHRQDSGLQNS